MDFAHFWNPHKPKHFYNVLDRFWAMVARGGPNECWPWIGSRDGRGYGQFMWLHPTGARRPMRSHRFAWTLFNGFLDENHFLRNTCRQIHCVNPRHWQLEADHSHTPATRVRIMRDSNSRSSATKATSHPTSRDIEWIVGFLEGEGNFRDCGTSQVRATQVNPEPVQKLVRLLGGSVTYRKHPNARHSPFYTWTTSGARARGIMMTVYSMMSEKRQGQIKQALYG